MEAILKPIVVGVLVGCLAIIGLWLIVPLLIYAISDQVLIMYPLLVYVSPLILALFVTARNMKSRFVYRYLIMGGVVGFLVVLILLSFGAVVEGSLGTTVFVMLSGISLGVFGAYLGNRLMKNGRVKS